jgi:hypothetical protein
LLEILEAPLSRKNLDGIPAYIGHVRGKPKENDRTVMNITDEHRKLNNNNIKMFYYMYLFSDNSFGQNNDHKKVVNSVTCNYKMA